MKKPQKISIIVFIVGLLTALTGAYIMFRRDIFAENNSGIATVIGIGLIAASNFRLLK